MASVKGQGSGKVRPRRTVRGGRGGRFLVEALEERRLLATITVNTAAGVGDPAAGTLSLFDAVEISNGQVPISSLSPAQSRLVVGASTVPNVIDFAIPGAGPFAIHTDLQPIEQPVIIDGYSQPGAHPNTNGPGLPDNAAIEIELISGIGSGLEVETGGCTFQGLAIGGTSDAIDLESGDNLVQGDFIGTDATGNVALPDTHFGISIIAGGPGVGNTIGGTSPGARNLISGNMQAGIFVSGQGVALIQGNFIGINAAGTAALPNGEGLLLDGGFNTIGGTAAGAGNVISGNSDTGLDVVGTRNLIQGNLIGTDPSGTVALGNSGDGVTLPQDRLQVFADPLPSTGTANLTSSVFTFGNTIGGTAAGAGNVIADNHGDGVSISVTFLSFNSISGFHGDESYQLIGYQQSPGSGQANTISGNSIFANTGLGIRLLTAAEAAGSASPIIPPPMGTPAGANGLLPAPVLAYAISGGSRTMISGTVAAAPSETLTVELFGDPAGSGQGRTYLGSVPVATDASGRGVFTFTSQSIVASPFVTATATDASGNTSEFAGDVPSVTLPTTSVTLLGPNRVATQGQPIAFTVAVASNVPGSLVGPVEFFEDGAPLGSATLGTNGLATFITDQLSPGPHVITASDAGDATHPASDPSNAIAVTVFNATAFGGPAVTSDVFSGTHAVTVTFNRGLLLDPAQDPANYKLVGPHHQHVAILSAVYNPANASVTLTTLEELDPHDSYQLTINGQAGDRVVDVFGIALNGKAKGKPGHDYSGKVAVKKVSPAKVAHPKAPKLKAHATAHQKGH